MRNIEQQHCGTDETKQLLGSEQNQRSKENKNRLRKIIVESSENIKRLQSSFNQKFTGVHQQASEIYDNLLRRLQSVDQQQGLSPRSIQRFHVFTAGSNQQCAICLEDICVGRRVNCDGQHTFCQVCCETWFANNNTCPLCRQAFL